MNHRASLADKRMRIVVLGAAVVILGAAWMLLGLSSGISPSGHPGDIYRSYTGPLPIGVARRPLSAQPGIRTSETIAGLLRASLKDAGRPTGINPSALSADGIVEPGEPYFDWEPADGWWWLSGAGVPGVKITRVEALLGNYFTNGSRDVLIQLDGLTYAANEYSINEATMRKIADLLYPPTVVSPSASGG